MDFTVLAKRMCHFDIQRLLLIIGILVAIVVVLQYNGLPEHKFSLSPTARSFITLLIGNSSTSTNPKYPESGKVNPLANGTSLSNSNEENSTMGSQKPDSSFQTYQDEISFSGLNLKSTSVNESVISRIEKNTNDNSSQLLADTSTNSDPETAKELKGSAGFTEEKDFRLSKETPMNGAVNSGTEGKTNGSDGANTSSTSNYKQAYGTQIRNESNSILQTVSQNSSNSSTGFTISDLLKRKPLLSISQMNSDLLKKRASTKLERPQQLSALDNELLSAKLKIENAPILRKTSGLNAIVFKNLSAFQRSYELMESIFKIYVYKEGEKPIFNDPYLLGIYAAEGWFLKLIKENEKFTVSDPGRAHMFYIPYSSNTFRISLRSNPQLDQEGYLEGYIKSLAEKYPFWNRTEGADHFVVACHDWAPKFTSRLKKSIRSLCNSDLKKGFKIGKDTSLPVINIRVAEKPVRDIGGKPPKERSLLAFFAGKVHGYLRPILVDYWHYRKPDMAIFGHDPVTKIGVKGYRDYINYMKNSKYCICAKGTSAHTPRVVESIYYECVPVIIADNYVPPFFEVLDWEKFAVFVQERDILDLRNILLSIPEQKYLALQRNVRLVQQHFFWHEKPVKYDLFHMILHSIWYNRIYQI